MIGELNQYILDNNTSQVKEYLKSNEINENSTLFPPLYWAVITNNSEIVEILIESGHSLELPSGHQISPLMMAIVYKASINIIKILIEKGSNVHGEVDHIYFRRHDKINPLYICIVTNCHINVLDLLFEEGANYHNPCVLYLMAGYWEDLSILKRLIKLPKQDDENCLPSAMYYLIRNINTNGITYLLKNFPNQSHIPM